MSNKVIIKFSFYTYKIEFTDRITVIALHNPFFILAILLYCVDTIMFCIQSLIFPYVQLYKRNLYRNFPHKANE